MAENQGSNSGGGGNTPLAQIPLRRVSRAELEASKKGGGSGGGAAPNPMNRLVPYLDLFGRLSDAELGRLTGVPPQTASQLRKQVDAVCDALASYADLLPRLEDAELMRLTGASAKTVRFWRLCQPRPQASAVEPATPEAAATPSPAPEPAAPPPSASNTRGSVAASHAAMAPSAGVPVRTATEPSGERTVAARMPTAAQSGSHRTLTDRDLRPSESGRHPVAPSREFVASEHRVVNEAAVTQTGRNHAVTDAELADETNDSQLSVGGAPFPGYEYDPGEAGDLDTSDDGIVIGLDLPDA